MKEKNCLMLRQNLKRIKVLREAVITIRRVVQKIEILEKIYFTLKWIKIKIGLDKYELLEERADPESPRWHNSSWYKVFKERIDYACQFVPNKLVLDDCCGVGWGTARLAKFAKHVYGIDYSQEAIDYANQHYNAENVTYKVMDALNLQYPDEYFDAVVAVEALEHFTQQNGLKFLEEIKRVLKKQGILIGSTPAVNIRNKTYLRFLMAKDKFHLCLYSGPMLETSLRKIFGNCDLILKDAGYYIFRAQK